MRQAAWRTRLAEERGYAISCPVESESLGLGDHEFVPWHLGIVS